MRAEYGSYKTSYSPSTTERAVADRVARALERRWGKGWRYCMFCQRIKRLHEMCDPTGRRLCKSCYNERHRVSSSKLSTRLLRQLNLFAKVQGMRWCWRCRRRLPESAFSSSGVHKCRVCFALYYKRRAKRKPRLISSFRLAAAIRRDLTVYLVGLLPKRFSWCKACGVAHPLDFFGRKSKSLIKTVCIAQDRPVQDLALVLKMRLQASAASRGERWCWRCRRSLPDHQVNGGSCESCAYVTDYRAVRNMVWDRDYGRCYLCGCRVNPSDWHLEHMIPKTLGGTDDARNLAVACPGCNLQKGVMTPLQFVWSKYATSNL